MRENVLDSGLGDVVKHGSIGPVWSDGCELIRRIFVTVRDKKWQEVAPQEWINEVQAPSRTVSISARHVSELVDFAWQGQLQITGNGRELTFEFTGKALRDMEVCRLGLVVLHPVEWMVGTDILAENAKSEQSVHLSGVIAPQPIVDGIPAAITDPYSTLRMERLGLGKLELRFGGDLFELEDQRNWGDASFKTYCTPLRLGFPRVVKANTIVRHSVQILFEPAPASSATGLRKQLPSPLGRLFPEIGQYWSPSGAIAEPKQTVPRWRHIHFPIADIAASLQALRDLLKSRSAPKIEVSLDASDAAFFSEVVALLFGYRERIARLQITGSGSSLPTEETMERVCRALAATPELAGVPVLMATPGYFVEFNRGIPLYPNVSGIACPLTATVHSDDASTIADNVAAIVDIANTSRDVLGVRQIAIAPLALYHPSSDPPRVFPAELFRPWFASTLMNAALAGVESITLANDVIAQCANWDGWNASPSLVELVACSGDEVLPLDSQLPAGVQAAVIRSAERGYNRLLAVNSTGRPVSVEYLGLKIDLPPFGTQWCEVK